MIRTYLVDGDKGGVGKTTVARFVADALINADSNGIDHVDRLYIIDADPSNADVCGAGGYVDDEIEGTKIFAVQHPIRAASDWISLIDKMEHMIGDHDKENVRLVFSLPAAAGLIILENSDIADMMAYFNGVSVWVLGNDESSVDALEKRVNGLPLSYEQGFAIRNLKHGLADSFRFWNESRLKKKLLGKAGGYSWEEIDFLALHHGVMLDLGRTPIHKAIDTREGADGKRLGLGTHISLKTFRSTMGRRLAVLEKNLGDNDGE